MRLLLAVLLFSHVEVKYAFGQDYVNRLLDLGGGELGGRVVLTDSNIYVYGVSLNQHGRHGLFMKMDLSGDTLYSKWFRPDSSDYWGALLKYAPDNTLLMGGSFRQQGTVGYTNHMAKWSLSGDTLWTVTWRNDTLSDIMRDAIVFEDGRMAVVGSRSRISPVRGGIYYTLLDSTGSILKDTMLTGYDYFDDPSSATLLPNGNMAVLFRRNKLVPYPDDYDIVVLEVTVDGEVVRQVEFDSPYRAWGAGISMDRNQARIILTGTVEMQPYWPSGMIIKAYLAVLDTQFTVLFDTIIGYKQLNHVSLWNHVIAGNGDIIFVGAASVGGNNPKDQAWIFRADSTYNIEWSRIYSSNYSHHNYLYDLKEDRDGNLVAVGSGYAQTQDLWIIRTDSAGCLVPNCDSLTWAGPEHQPFAVQMYPNPFSSQFTIELPPAAAQASVTVSDLSGRMVYNAHSIAGTHHISASAWPPGLYLVQVATTEGVWRGKVVKVK